MERERSLRVSWVDTTKGFAIFLVVLGHVWRGLNSAGMLDGDMFRALDSRIYAFHMPLFFLLGGLFFPKTLARLDLFAFLASRVRRLIYPLLLWTYVFIVFKLLAGSMANTPIGAGELLVPPIPGRWHFWFLWALFLVHLALFPARPLVTEPAWTGRGFLALLVLSLGLYAIKLPPLADYWIGPAIHHLPYFVIGLILGRMQLETRVRGWGMVAALAVFAVTVALFPQLYAAGVPFLATATVLSLAATVFFAGLGEGGGLLRRALTYAGERSMAIFLSHVIFQAALRAVLLKIGVTSVPLHLILGTMAGLILPIVLNDVAIRLKIVRFLGF